MPCTTDSLSKHKKLLSFFKDGFIVAGTSPKAWIFFPLIFPQFINFNENYVFDAVGMIGSVGGTLGMCIGFSFSGLTSHVLSFVKSKIKVHLVHVSK